MDPNCPACSKPLTSWRTRGGWKLCRNHTVSVRFVLSRTECQGCDKPIRRQLALVVSQPYGQELYLHYPANTCGFYYKQEEPKQAYKKVEEERPPACPYSRLHLTPDAPTEVVKAAYKALCFLHHPDHGGTTEQMQLINAAMQEIMEQ